jgi:hypothetical protein
VKARPGLGSLRSVKLNPRQHVELTGCDSDNDAYHLLTMRIIFLDVDGVLNSESTPNPRKLPYIVERACSNS